MNQVVDLGLKTTIQGERTQNGGYEEELAQHSSYCCYSQNALTSLPLTVIVLSLIVLH